nr:hypothetical protein [Tanacetum cinerariifolium]
GRDPGPAPGHLGPAASGLPGRPDLRRRLYPLARQPGAADRWPGAWRRDRLPAAGAPDRPRASAPAVADQLRSAGAADPPSARPTPAGAGRLDRLRGLDRR